MEHEYHMKTCPMCKGTGKVSEKKEEAMEPESPGHLGTMSSNMGPRGNKHRTIPGLS